VGRAIAQLIPAPNVAGAPSRNNNYRFNQPVENPSNVFVTRIDHNFNANHRVYGRYLVTAWNFTDSGPIFPTPGVDSSHQRSDGGYHNWSVTYLHNFKPTLLGELRYQADWRKFHNYGGGLGLGLAERIGLRGTNPLYFPRINATGMYSLGSGEQERKQVPIRGDNWTYSLTNVAAARRGSSACSTGNRATTIFRADRRGATSASRRSPPATRSLRCSPAGWHPDFATSRGRCVRSPRRSASMRRTIGAFRRS